jgi:hypothetical protein
MIRLLMAGLLLASFNTLAATQVSNTFENGDIIEAEKFNTNFDDLEAAIDNVLSSPAPGAIALLTTGQVGISLTTNGGTNEKIVLTSNQGDKAESIKLDAVAGGITLSAAANITLLGDVTANDTVTVVGATVLSSVSASNVNVSNSVVAGNQVIASGVVLSSDARLKEAVSSVGVGLGLINDLNPVRYHRINNPESDIEMGLMAQEVEATLAKHGLGNSGMVVQPEEKGYLYLRYNDLLAPMIKAIQELDDASEAKDEQIASLQQKLESQQEELLAIVQSQQEQIAQLQKLVEHQFASN